MRRPEASFSRSRVETRDQYLARLKRTALSLPTSFVTRAVQDMHRRVRAVRDAKGGVFKRDWT